MQYKVEISRTSSRTVALEITASSAREAESLALAMAGDIEFPAEVDAVYEASARPAEGERHSSLSEADLANWEALAAPDQNQIIFSLSERGFWNNETGWGDQESATRYSMSEIGTVTLPMSSWNDARWTTPTEVSVEDIESVLSDYALRVANTNGQSFRHIAEELILEIDADRVTTVAQEVDEPARVLRVRQEIRAILLEMGVLEF